VAVTNMPGCVSAASLSYGKSWKTVYSEWSRNGSMNVTTLSQRFSIRIFFFNKTLTFVSFV